MKKNQMRTGSSRFLHIDNGMKSLLFFLFLSACTFTGIAQAPTKISGKVQSSTGAPLGGATVSVKGGTVSTSTDSAGSFTITAPSNGTLEITYVGYKKQEVPINGQTVLLISVEPSGEGMDEVIVVGYNTQRRKTVTGAIATVNMGDAEARRVPDVAQVLQGQVAGVQVTQSTGAPGDEISIRIRGEGTIGNNSPLFVVDGVPSRDITFLNPADIQSMTVLKDASAAAMYGSRGSAGVVLITTKSGRKGKTVVDVNYFTGIQQAADLPEMLNAQQYMSKLEETWNNNPDNAGGNNPYTADKNRTDLANTDWLKETFETGKSQNLQLTLSGGTDKVQYLLSGAYYKQDGIVVYDRDQYKRISVRSNLNINVTDRLTVGTNLQLMHSTQDKLSSKGDAPGIIRHAMLRPPVIPVYKDPSDPTWSKEDPFTDLPFYKSPTDFQANKYEWTSNPVALAFFTNDVRTRFKTFGNIYGEYAFLREKELKFRTNLGVDINYTHNKAFYPNFGDDENNANFPGMGRKNRPNALTDDRGEEMNFTWTNTLNYSKRFNKHQVSALAGTEYITWKTANTGGSRNRFDYETPNFQYLDYGNTQTDIWNGGSGSDLGLFSLFGTATYTYDSKYMFTANFRADASSNFGENKRWGYFPSMSVGWRISEENFMRDINWLDDLRLRASVGSLGNQELPYYVYKTLFTLQEGRYRLIRMGNPNLKWETTTQTNFGVDLALLRNKLTMSVDYFVKKTSDILLPLSLPEIFGELEATSVNAGDVSNKGIEIALGYRNAVGEFKYGINANFAAITNKVDHLHPNLPILQGDVFRTTAGQPLGAFYGYNMIGIYQNQAEIDKHLPNTAGNSKPLPGYIKFEDRNSDGVINSLDRTFIGNPNPKYTYGLTLTGSYKGFDLNILFQGVQDVDKYNDLKKITDYDTRPFNHSTRTLGSWHGEGTSNSIPIATTKDNGSSRISSIYVEDASYLRLKNIELGYSFKNVLKRMAPGIQNLRVYVSAQNVFTITDYTGLDPESTDMVDMGTYPLSRAILFGVNINF
jgi:TonB-linked SusC/RagA family outer membrane protein